MSRQTQEIVTCDYCKGKIGSPFDSAQICGMDTCKPCLEQLHNEVELEYRRLIKGEVPSRRGGWRKLGEYDG